jgi:Delta7-sterol 5-desaturase
MPFLFIAASIAITLAVYFGVGGVLHARFYRRRRGRAAEWKCQPYRWLPRNLERHALTLGTINLSIAGAMSGLLIYRIWAGAPSALYFNLRARHPFYTVLSTIVLFLITDAGAYYAHRMFHSRWLFARIHTWHHRYTVPNAFTVAAMHPLEWFVYQAILYLPAFVMPLWAPSYVAILLYTYYVGLISHSGVKLRSAWPWQPATPFHDDHHKHFDCNFGQSTDLWDRLHRTLR